MKVSDFNKLATKTLEECKKLLLFKGNEYNDPNDYFAYFRRAGAFLESSPKEALLGMFVKHLISISDMCRSESKFDSKLWDEKIYDAINYLVLLRGIVEDEENE